MALGSKLLERYIEAIKLNQGVKSGYAAWFASSAASTSGGSTDSVVKVGPSGAGFYTGTGAPTLSAAKGSVYTNVTATTTTTRLYVNTDGATTWTNLTTAA